MMPMLDRGPNPDAGSLRAHLPAGVDLLGIVTRFGPAIAGWILPFALVLYLALKGGGYDDVVRGEVGVAVWWLVLLGALVGVLPAARIGRAGWVGLGLLVAFGAWTALGITWSDSAGRSVAEVGRIAMYAGVLALALAAQGRAGLRRTVNAVATAIAVVAALALLSRLHPAWLPADDTASFLPGIKARLNYPLNYWNGLAALVAIGIPLILVAAARAQRIPLRALAAGAVPAMGLAAYYTFSRGGALEIAVALLFLLALYPGRLELLLTLIPTGAGTAILIGAATQRHALDDGLHNAAAHSQGNEMLAVVLVVCAGVALVQVAIALAARYEVGPRLHVGRRASLIALGAAALAAIVIALGAGLPHKLSNDWDTFKHPSGSIESSAGRFTSASSNGRYQYWRSSERANATNPLIGIGPGTWQFWWEEHGTLPGYVVNAHSLYFETLAEVGIVGLAVIVGLLLWVLTVGTRRALTASRDRSLLAGATAAAAAFTVAAGVDWVWQMPVIPVAFLLIGGAILGARRSSPTRPSEPEHSNGRSLAPRVVLGILALVSLIAIAIPLAGAEAVAQSQAEVRASNLGGALDDARTARDIQPYSADASLQEALVLELRGDLNGAAEAARTATGQESNNWKNWLVLSRIEAERGNSSAALAAYQRAKSLNPRSTLFTQ